MKAKQINCAPSNKIDYVAIELASLGKSVAEISTVYPEEELINSEENDNQQRSGAVSAEEYQRALNYIFRLRLY